MGVAIFYFQIELEVKNVGFCRAKAGAKLIKGHFKGNGYESRQSSLFHVFVRFFGLDHAHRTRTRTAWSGLQRLSQIHN